MVRAMKKVLNCHLNSGIENDDFFCKGVYFKQLCLYSIFCGFVFRFWDKSINSS